RSSLDTPSQRLGLTKGIGRHPSSSAVARQPFVSKRTAAPEGWLERTPAQNVLAERRGWNGRGRILPRFAPSITPPHARPLTPRRTPVPRVKPTCQSGCNEDLCIR